MNTFMNTYERYIREAEENALEEGYDQVIYMTKRGIVKVNRITAVPVLNPNRIIGIVRLTYRDKVLGTRFEAGRYRIRELKRAM